MISYNQNYLKVWNFSNLLFRLNTSSFLQVLVFCWFECMESIWDEISIELIIMPPLNEKPLMISRNVKSLERLKHKLDWWNQVCDSLIWKKMNGIIAVNVSAQVSRRPHFTAIGRSFATDVSVFVSLQILVLAGDFIRLITFSYWLLWGAARRNQRVSSVLSCLPGSNPSTLTELPNLAIQLNQPTFLQRFWRLVTFVVFWIFKFSRFLKVVKKRSWLKRGLCRFIWSESSSLVSC